MILIAIVVYSSFFGRTFFQNKKTQTAKAADFSSDTFIGLDKTYDYGYSQYGGDITVENGATVTIDGEHTFKDVTLKNGGKITHSAVSTKGLMEYSADYFTIRWTGFIQIPSGVSTLYAYADDQARILVRKTSETNWSNSNWSNGPSVSVSAGLYEIEVDYYEGIGGAFMYLYYITDEAKFFLVPSSWLYLKQDKTTGTCGAQTGTNGLCGEYFANHYPSDLFSGPPARSRIDSQINFNWGSGSPFNVEDNFTARWRGFVELPASNGANQGIGTYSDNGVKIRLKKVSPDSWANWQEWSNWSDSWTGYTFTGYILSPGLYEIDLQYIEGSGNAFIELFGYYMSDRSGLNYILPNSQLFLKQDKTTGTCGFQTGVNGLCGEYFAFRSIANPFPNEQEPWSQYLSNLTRIDQVVNVSWGTSHPFIGGLRLKILGNLTLDGGYIDVSEKGYPGGVVVGVDEVTPGYGPGGGDGDTHSLTCGVADDIGGGGGGYGGVGAFGRGWYSAAGGSTYGTKETPQTAPNELDLYSNEVPAIFGSGGGGGIHEYCDLFGSHHHRYYTGGRGGGSIILDVASGVVIEYNSNYPWAGIYANGGPGTEYSGGGSGGLIYIKSRGLWESNVGGQAIVSGGEGAGDGTTWNVQTNTVSLAGYGGRIQAKGGAGYTSDECSTSDQRCGGGGGGRIVIDAPLRPSRTVNKSPLATPVINDGNLKTYTITYNSGISGYPFGTDGYKIVDELPQDVSYFNSEFPYNYCYYYSRSDNKVTWDLNHPACSNPQGTITMFVSLGRNLCNTTITNQIYIIDGQGNVVPGSRKWVSNYVECKVAFSGDIFGGSIALTNPSSGDIVSTSSGAPVFGKWKIGNYAMNPPANWEGIKGKVSEAVGRLKKYAVPNINSVQNAITHMNNNTSTQPPEGWIYYLSGTGTEILSGVTLQGKGTIILDGGKKLSITGNVSYSTDPAYNPSLGIIVLNTATDAISVQSGVSNLFGAYFATGDITFPAGLSSFNFKGLLAGSTIKLPQSGNFSYDPRLATNPPPGFREIFKALYQEAAP